MEETKVVTGSWLDAIGTIISAIAEVRKLIGLNDVNNKLVVLGEAMQAIGALVIGTVSTEDPLNFTGNFIDGAGAATSSMAAYLQDQEQENGEDSIRLGIFGDSLQSLGALLSALSDHLSGQDAYALGNLLQGFGAALEAIGGVYQLNNRENEAQLITTIGAIILSIGSNFNAINATRDLIGSRGIMGDLVRD